MALDSAQKRFAVVGHTVFPVAAKDADWRFSVFGYPVAALSGAVSEAIITSIGLSIGDSICPSIT